MNGLLHAGSCNRQAEISIHWTRGFYNLCICSNWGDEVFFFLFTFSNMFVGPPPLGNCGKIPHLHKSFRSSVHLASRANVGPLNCPREHNVYANGSSFGQPTEITGCFRCVLYRKSKYLTYVSITMETSPERSMGYINKIRNDGGEIVDKFLKRQQEVGVRPKLLTQLL